MINMLPSIIKYYEVISVTLPCKILREVNGHDREYYFKDKKIDWEQLNG